MDNSKKIICGLDLNAFENFDSISLLNSARELALFKNPNASKEDKLFTFVSLLIEKENDVKDIFEAGNINCVCNLDAKTFKINLDKFLKMKEQINSFNAEENSIINNSIKELNDVPNEYVGVFEYLYSNMDNILEMANQVKIPTIKDYLNKANSENKERMTSEYNELSKLYNVTKSDDTYNVSNNYQTFIPITEKTFKSSGLASDISRDELLDICTKLKDGFHVEYSIPRDVNNTDYDIVRKRLDFQDYHLIFNKENASDKGSEGCLCTTKKSFGKYPITLQIKNYILDTEKEKVETIPNFVTFANSLFTLNMRALNRQASRKGITSIRRKQMVANLKVMSKLVSGEDVKLKSNEIKNYKKLVGILATRYMLLGFNFDKENKLAVMLDDCVEAKFINQLNEMNGHNEVYPWTLSFVQKYAMDMAMEFFENANISLKTVANNVKSLQNTIPEFGSFMKCFPMNEEMEKHFREFTDKEFINSTLKYGKPTLNDRLKNTSAKIKNGSKIFYNSVHSKTKDLRTLLKEKKNNIYKHFENGLKVFSGKEKEDNQQETITSIFNPLSYMDNNSAFTRNSKKVTFDNGSNFDLSAVSQEKYFEIVLSDMEDYKSICDRMKEDKIDFTKKNLINEIGKNNYSILAKRYSNDVKMFESEQRLQNINNALDKSSKILGDIFNLDLTEIISLRKNLVRDIDIISDEENEIFNIVEENLTKGGAYYDYYIKLLSIIARYLKYSEFDESGNILFENSFISVKQFVKEILDKNEIDIFRELVNISKNLGIVNSRTKNENLLTQASIKSEEKYQLPLYDTSEIMLKNSDPIIKLVENASKTNNSNVANSKKSSLHNKGLGAINIKRKIVKSMANSFEVAVTKAEEKARVNPNSLTKYEIGVLKLNKNINMQILGKSENNHKIQLEKFFNDYYKSIDETGVGIYKVTNDKGGLYDKNEVIVDQIKRYLGNMSNAVTQMQKEYNDLYDAYQNSNLDVKEFINDYASKNADLLLLKYISSEDILNNLEKFACDKSKDSELQK